MASAFARDPNIKKKRSSKKSLRKRNRIVKKPATKSGAGRRAAQGPAGSSPSPSSSLSPAPPPKKRKRRRRRKRKRTKPPPTPTRICPQSAAVTENSSSSSRPKP